MSKLVLILSIFSLIPFEIKSLKEEHKKIDFWTDKINDILIHFRFDENTHELLMFQEEHTNSTNRLEFKVKRVNENDTTTIVETTDPTITTTSFTRPTKKTRKIRENSATNTTTTTLASISEDNFTDTSPSESTIWTTTTINPLSIDSCNLNCSPGRPHIACGNNWSLSPTCPPTAKVINIDHLQNVILHTHNNFRNQLAGNLTNFEPAARMGTTQWHSELAAYAQLNVMRCNNQHDRCHNTKEFRRAGQNLARYSWTGLKKDLKTILIKLISGWYKEELYAEQSDMDNFTSSTGLNNETISHFTAIVNDRNTHIGCAALNVKSGRWTSIYFACNYACNNIFKKAIYRKGETASKCLTGINPEYTNLCSVNEVYDYNN